MWPTMDGRDFLEAIGRRELSLPPILEVLGITEGAAGDGWIEFAMTPQPFMLNLAGTVHGGVLSTLMDSALTCALVTRLSKGFACTTLDMQIRFIRPVRAGVRAVTARAEVIQHGANIGVTAGYIRDDRGRAMVHATSSLAIAPVDTLLKER